MQLYDTDNPTPDAEFTMPIAGRIAAGRKKLTPAALQNIDNAQTIYDRGEAAGASYDDIEKFLMSKAPATFKKRPLMPVNAPFFRVGCGDFVNPANVDVIMNYAETRDEAIGPQLYTLPVVFPVDDISQILQEGFTCYAGSKLQFWRDKGGRCVQLPEPVKGRRRFGRREPIERKPMCDPNGCDEFAEEKCNHQATLLFYVPGITGTGVIALRFRSVYAAAGIRSTLETTRRGLGRISGLFAGEPMFWLSKQEKMVNKIDWKTGSVSKVRQQIITLEARGVDMMQFFAAMESDTTARLEAPKQQNQVTYRGSPNPIRYTDGDSAKSQAGPHKQPVTPDTSQPKSQPAKQETKQSQPDKQPAEQKKSPSAEQPNVAAGKSQKPDAAPF